MINLVHDIDLLRHLLGEVTSVAAVGSTAIRNATRIESGVAALQFASGAAASIAFADTTPSPWGFEAGTGENPNIADDGPGHDVDHGNRGRRVVPVAAGLARGGGLVPGAGGRDAGRRPVIPLDCPA